MEQDKLAKIATVLSVVALIFTAIVLFRETRTVVEVNVAAPESSLGATARVAGTVSEFTSLFNNFTGQIEVDGASLFTGTTTVSRSVDGLIIGGNISVTATGTVLTLDTNTTGPKVCNATPAILYAESSSSFAPSYVVSVGTSTSAVASTNLVASSTIATTTSTIVSPTASEFLYDSGNRLTAIVGDITNTEASTTHMGNWNGVNISIPCWNITF